MSSRHAAAPMRLSSRKMRPQPSRPSLIPADPVETGLAAGLARPGDNRTGVTTLTQLLWQKRLELIAELVPQTRVIGLLVNPNRALVGRVVDSTQQAANAKGLQLEILKAGTEAEIDAAFATAVQ